VKRERPSESPSGESIVYGRVQGVYGVPYGSPGTPPFGEKKPRKIDLSSSDLKIFFTRVSKNLCDNTHALLSAKEEYFAHLSCRFGLPPQKNDSSPLNFKMSHRRKRQKLSGHEQEQSSREVDDEQLSHSKTERRSLFVRSLAQNTTTEDLTEHFSQSDPIKHALIVNDPLTKQGRGYGFVTFADAEDAQQALKDFDGTMLNGKKMKLEIAEPRHREEETGHDDGPIVSKRKGQTADEPQPSSKLIVRNLPWSIDTSEKLTHLFLSYGKVKHAVVPKNRSGRMSGFGIIVLRGRKNAEKALQGVNGKVVDGRTLAVDWAVDKETWQKVQKDEPLNSLPSEEVEGLPNEDEINEYDDNDAGHLMEPNLEASEEEEQMVEASSEVDDGEGSFASLEVDGSRDSAALAQTSSEESTIFVRNLPFTCTDEDVDDHFSQFGRVRYARIVVDATTGRSKGTAFVRFSKQADAERCIREAPKTTATKAIGNAVLSSSDNKTNSVLQDELLDPTGKYSIDGRILQVAKAVNRLEADRLTKEGAARRNARDKDKRRLYLLTEGSISSNSPLYKQLSSSEIGMREASAKQRRTLVESNPSLHLSLTRLAVRNIPHSISSKDLKALAREAVVGFATDVKGGLRQPLSKEELSRAREEMSIAERERKLKGKGVVKQAKIVFEGRKGEKVAESSGAGRSRGYGFIEYYTHRSALMGLRWLNGHAIDYEALVSGKANKVDKSERKKRLIVEFALENANVVHRRKERESKPRKRGDLREGNMGIANQDERRERRRASAAAKTTERQEDLKEDRDRAAGREENAKRQKIIANKRAKRRARKASSSKR